MSQTLAVAARELRERWLMFPAGLAVGLAPFLMTSFGLRAEQTPVVGVLLAILLGAVAAFVAGGSMLARDTSDGRLAFLFSRPVPWPAIWGGKWIAAVVLVFGSAFLALVPVILAYPPPSPAGAWRSVLLGPKGSALFFVLLFMAIGLSNFNATAFRSRSAWLALDLGLFVIAIRLAVVWVGPLFALHVFHPGATGRWVGLLAVPALALFLATLAQVGVGRTDLRRAHRALSVVFWSLVFVALGASGLGLAWARAATPADLTAYAGGSADPSGRWLYVVGESRRGGAATFLVDADRNRYVPLGVRHAWEWLSRGMAFSAEGESGIALQHRPEHSSLLHVDLGGAEPHFTNIELESTPPPAHRSLVALSDSGATAVLAHDNGASLFEIPSGRRVATATIPPGWRPAATRFLEEQAVRVWLLPMVGLQHGSTLPAEMRILELRAGREPHTRATPLEAMVDQARSWPHMVHADDAGRRVLTHDGGLRLRDGATGALIATLYEGSAPTSATFLDDGRIVASIVDGSRPALKVFSPDGVPQGDVVLSETMAKLSVGLEVAPGQVAVSVYGTADSRETRVVDLAEGRVVETLVGLHHLWDPYGFPGSASRIPHFALRDGAVVRFDFTTGEERIVAGEGSSPGERLSR